MTARRTYQQALRARSIKPVRGQIRTDRAEGTTELLTGGGLGMWIGGKLVPVARRTG